MGRKSILTKETTKGKFLNKSKGFKTFKGSKNSAFKAKDSKFKKIPKHAVLRNKINHNFDTNTNIQHKPKATEDPTDSSDSEQDAFSQLVSCFTNKSKDTSIMSDDDESELSSEEESVNLKEGSLTSTSIDVNNEEKNCDMSEEFSHSSSESDEDIDDEHFSNSCNTDKNDDKVDLSLADDPFENHIQYDLDENLLHAVSSTPQITEEVVKHWPTLGQLKIVIPKSSNRKSQINKKMRIDSDVVYAKPGYIPSRLDRVSEIDWERLCVKSQIRGNIHRTNCKYVDESLSDQDQLTNLQKELFSIINNYQDLYYPERTLDNAEEIRFVYCLHVINHVLKTRLKVVHHNARLANKNDLKSEIPDEFRDQGLVRPKVLILVPFRSSAVKVVDILTSILLEEGNNNVLNRKRFYDEFNAAEIVMPRKNPKPEDYERTFAGDTDDNFKIGLSVTKKSLKLYSDFYSADIIIASPLGMRVIVGAEGQADRDFDFLASIELLILDQAEIILMQNWDHLLQVWDHLHMQPKQSHGTNFARVRPWALSGRARYYRQTLLFSSHALPQISALFSRKCVNYAGRVCVVNPIKAGSICQIILQLPQVFNRIECTSPTDSIDARFHYFVNKVLPQYKEPLMNHTLVYVPSYFDYVRIRNHFKKEVVSFVQICEYSKDGKIARARDMFFHSSAHFLLYSERFHFFRRIRLKGIRHIVFYQPPTIPHFYSELCNLMQSVKGTEEGSLSVSVLYTRYDAAQLAAIVGSERTARMLASDRPVHMFMTGD